MSALKNSDYVRPKDAIIIIDRQDRIKEWDQQAEQIFGWSSNDIKGRRLCDLILSPSYCDFYLQNTKKFLKDYSSKFLYTEVEALDRKGHSFPVELTVTGPHIHDRREITVLVHDISVLKQAESIKGLLAAIVESSEDAIISVKIDDTINSWNDSAERMFGYSMAEAIGQNISMVVPADLQKKQHDIRLQVQAGKKIQHYEMVWLCKDKQYIDVNVTISPVRDTAGEITGAYYV